MAASGNARPLPSPPLDDPPKLLSVPSASRQQQQQQHSQLEAANEPAVKRSKSVRTRPSEAMERLDSAPLPHPPPAPAAPPELRPRASKMSLFSLFSKPKVERLRGYAEQGLAPPPQPPPPPPPQQSPPRQQQQQQSQQQLHQPLRVPADTARPSSSWSSARPGRFQPQDSALPPLPTERRLQTFNPVPLFQAWPQTTRHAVLEISPLAPDTIGRTSATLFTPGSDPVTLNNTPGHRGSLESRAPANKSPLRHFPSGSFSLPALPRKLFLLTTSGFLLQYSESGSNERLPEKMLQLGRDSAAFASDLVPGRHHVLQISQAVDQKGVPVNPSTSIFSRFGMRGHAGRRTASTFLLVMSDAEEMACWMASIRKEIESQGGKRVRADSSASRPRSNAAPQLDLNKSPSQSHRYQVKRDPSGPSIVPTAATLDDAPPSPYFPLDVGSASAAEPSSATYLKPSSQSEHEESNSESVRTRARAPSDTASTTSSIAISVDHNHLDRLQSGARTSHPSTAATSVTGPSRASSITSSPSDHTKETETGREAGVKAAYRASSAHTLQKRRSAAPLSINATKPNDRLDLSSSSHDVHLPLSVPASLPTPSPKHHRLSTAQSTPNLTTVVESKHDSKMAATSTTPLLNRPESFLADLPTTPSWAQRSSPALHRPTVPFPPLIDSAATDDTRKTSSPKARVSPTSRPLRSGSNSFSLPLRINPTDSPTTRHVKRPSGDAQDENVISPIPAVTTLTAKVDFASRTTINVSHIPARKSSNPNAQPRDVGVKTAPLDASLLSPTRSPPPTPTAAPTTAEYSRPASMKLSRPASLQIRSSHAPFLSSMRSTSALSPRQSVTTAPVRCLKPSRSMNTVMQSTSRGRPPAALNCATRPTGLPRSLEVEEPVDHASPLPSTPLTPAQLRSPALLVSPALPRSASRASSTNMARCSAIPSVDLTALGPPAPPPSAPLPQIPTEGGKRTPSPREPRHFRLSMNPAGAPIGVAIGDASHDDTVTATATATAPAASPPTFPSPTQPTMRDPPTERIPSVPDALVAATS